MAPSGTDSVGSTPRRTPGNTSCGRAGMRKTMPPKNMISVSRKSHMPKLPASRCCCFGFEVMTVLRQRRRAHVLRAWTAVSCVCGCVLTIALSNGRHLIFQSSFRATRSRRLRSPRSAISMKVLGQRRRLDLPLKASGLPRIVDRQSHRTSATSRDKSEGA